MYNDQNNSHPNRAPKKYPKKSLHGRVRTAFMHYKNYDRVREFYINVFGWDIFKLPKGVLGNNAKDETPHLVCATGPSQLTWEGSIPGYVSTTLFHAENGDEKPYMLIEVDMEQDLEVTLERIKAKGGTVIEGNFIGGAWADVAMVEDPEGNRAMLWKCPDSRTWDEPETEYDRE